MTAGVVGGQAFMVVDGVLVSELVDPNPLNSGSLGFSAYCTKLKIKDIEVRRPCVEDFIQTYVPEF